MTPTTYSIIALSIASVALIFTIRNYLRKAGVYVRGSFSIHDSISCDDKYVGSLVLENLKDRAITIFAIYLKVGYSYYIEIESFDESPHVLKPFETYKKDYDPIAFYSVSLKRIELNRLLSDGKIKKRLILSTSAGKYTVATNVPRWNPIVEFFQNHLTAVIKPIRSIYKNKAYGSNVKFLVELTFQDGKKQIVPIHSTDYQYKVFKNFKLTKESLESAPALETLLNDEISKGNLSCLSFKIQDLEEWRGAVYQLEEMPLIKAEPIGKFKYYILGNIFTIISDWRLKRQNRTTLRNSKKDMRKPGDGPDKVKRHGGAMKIRFIPVVKYLSMFLFGLIVGAFLLESLEIYLRPSYRKLIIRTHLKTEQEFLAQRAARENRLLETAFHRWAVVNAVSEEGFRVFRKNNEELDASPYLYPLNMLVLKSMASGTNIERGKEISEGIDCGKLAAALEAMGRKKEAEEQWRRAQLLTRYSTMKTTKDLVYKLLEQEKTDIFLKAEDKVLGTQNK